MYSVHITDIAEEDIVSAVKYISGVLNAPAAANRLLDEIEKHETILEHTPNIFPFVPDEPLTNNGIKYAMVKNYMLFYIIHEEDKIVTVLRFLYGRRDWKNIISANTMSLDEIVGARYQTPAESACGATNRPSQTEGKAEPARGGNAYRKERGKNAGV
ncbi:MAG: type II toxin-antitoxin system RelE/ParE family toxin [Spirochaetaceae bacterium]|nr:type II toxin-antitoxin system RelE/ParE family toxin [Spirochaetaceae bacterium]